MATRQPYALIRPPQSTWMTPDGDDPRTIAEAKKLIDEAAEVLTAYLSDIGTCHHYAKICCCDEYDLLQRMRAFVTDNSVERDP